MSERAAHNYIAGTLEEARRIIECLARGSDADQARALEHLAGCEGLFTHPALDLGEALLAEAEAAAQVDLTRTAYLHDPTPDALRRYLRAQGTLLLRIAPVCAAGREELCHG